MKVVKRLIVAAQLIPGGGIGGGGGGDCEGLPSVPAPPAPATPGVAVADGGAGGAAGRGGGAAGGGGGGAGTGLPSLAFSASKSCCSSVCFARASGGAVWVGEGGLTFGSTSATAIGTSGGSFRPGTVGGRGGGVGGCQGGGEIRQYTLGT